MKTNNGKRAPARSPRPPARDSRLAPERSLVPPPRELGRMRQSLRSQSRHLEEEERTTTPGLKKGGSVKAKHSKPKSR
jgi:hypothetical protein